MKKLIVLFFIYLTSCGFGVDLDNKNGGQIVKIKSMESPILCIYEIRSIDVPINIIQIIDSCSKFTIGDTVKFKFSK